MIEKSIRDFKLLDRIAHPPQGVDAVDLMRLFVDRLTRDIEQYRVDLLRLGPRERVALITLHHLVSDGWSIGVFLRELGQLYARASAGRGLL